MLNESGYVSPETRERVQAAIDELDFRPNLLARGLISRASYTIALIRPDLTNPFCGPLAKGVEAVARAEGLSAIICNAENDPLTVGEWIRRLRNNWVNGVLFAMDPPLEDVGLKVPEDISMVGYDDILWARRIKPGLTTVAQPVEELGRLTAALLVKRINQEPVGNPQRICLNTNLILRASTASPRGVRP